MITTHAQSDSSNARTDRDWNRWIGGRLREAAQLLSQQGANRFRIGAYTRAANTLDRLDQDISLIYAENGFDGLVALPNIGRSIASAIAEMLRTGTWGQLERLKGALDPVQLFRTVPGIGPQLSRDIHDHLQVDSLEALEVAAYDGRLLGVPGIGRRRLTMIRQGLDNLLARRRPQRAAEAPPRPAVALLLDVDHEYATRAAAGKLDKIQPRRFPSSSGPWLPILHTQRGVWHFTALFSNTPRAHQLGRTQDWVVIYYHTDNEPEGQCTVVTEHAGPLRGRRVVRGREDECIEYYRSLAGNNRKRRPGKTSGTRGRK